MPDNGRRPIFHLGLGKLGLGLAVPLMAAKAPVVGLYRETSNARHHGVLRERLRYTRLDPQTGSAEQFRLEAVMPYGADGLLSAAEQHGPPAAVTCAIKSGFDELFALLAALADKYREAYRETPLLFLPFENARNVGTDAVEFVNRVTGEPLLLAADLIVDKVCSDIDSVTGECRVTAEGKHELTIGIPISLSANRVARRIAQVGLEQFVVPRPQFEFEVRKKAWIVNGLHYCIEMVALEQDIDTPSIPDLLHMPVVANAAAAFTREVAVALEVFAAENGATFNSEAIVDFIEDVVTRMRSTPDSIERINRPMIHLRHLLRGIGHHAGAKTDVVEFGDTFRKWSERIAEPAEIVLRHHEHLTGPLLSPRLSLFLLKWIGDYLAWQRNSTRPR